MKKSDYEYKLKYLGIKDKYELLERYEYLFKEVRKLKEYKKVSTERYNKMSKLLITYMDKYGSLDNKKGKNNGI